MPRFRKKPVVVEAEQFDPARKPWPEGVEMWNEAGLGYAARYRWSVSTLEGDMAVNPGDWIIQGVEGGLYPCKPGIFEATYEPADAPTGDTEP